MPASPCELGARPPCHRARCPSCSNHTALLFPEHVRSHTTSRLCLAGASAWEAVLPGLHDAGLPRCPGPGPLLGKTPRRSSPRCPSCGLSVTPCSPFLSSALPLSLRHRPTGGCSVRPSGRFLLLLLEVCVLAPLFTVSPAPRRGHCRLSLSTAQACVLGSSLLEARPGRTPAHFGNLSRNFCSLTQSTYPKADPSESASPGGRPPTPLCTPLSYLSLSHSSSSLGYTVVTAAHRSLVLSHFPPRHHKEMSTSSANSCGPSPPPSKPRTEKISHSETEFAWVALRSACQRHLRHLPPCTSLSSL